jgi:uncharacterized protein YkwD
MRHLWLFTLLGVCVALLPGEVRAYDLPCRHEDVLAETAAGFLLSNRAVQAAELLPAAQALGFDGVALHAHEGRDDARLIEWLKGIADRADGPLVCGEAASESRRLVLVAVRGGRLKLGGHRISGELSPGFRSPELVLEGRDGEIRRIPVSQSALAAGVKLEEGFELRRVQLLAEGVGGPRPVAELVPDPEARRVPIAASWTNVEEPRGPRARPTSALLARIDGYRREHGVSGLRSNDLLSHSAQRHAQRVCELGRVAHRLREGEDPETRLREEHIEARAVGEAIARAESADAALSAVFDSPSHRAAVTERRFTDAGVGQALDAKGHTCLVVLLAAWPRRTP